MGAEQGPGPEASEGQAASSRLCLGWDWRVSSALAEAWEGLVEDLAPGQESASPEMPGVHLYGSVTLARGTVPAGKGRVFLSSLSQAQAWGRDCRVGLLSP